jgi:hypothetical protein
MNLVLEKGRKVYINEKDHGILLDMFVMDNRLLALVEVGNQIITLDPRHVSLPKLINNKDLAPIPSR